MTKTFEDLGLSKPILKALAHEGYVSPTPIQAKAIPVVMAGRDLLGIAQTGTGKTAAFALPILDRLQADPTKRPLRGTCRVLVLSPTRELATQIADSFKAYGKHLGLKIAVVFGGVKYGAQIKAITGGLDVLVATPGRLLDHVGERVLDLSATEIFVLDEADQMLDLGFVKPIRQVASKLPARRQNLFFSATMPGEIAKLAGELLKDPQRVEVTPQATTVEKIQQSVLFVEGARKRALLSELFADPTWTRTLIFTKTKRGADKVAAYLEAGGVDAAAIHGDKSQGQRERALQAFKDGRVRALVATDIAARGIDIDSVTHVVNFELPFVAEAYVHRIGRTARAGASGIAVSFCADDERNLLKDIQRLTRQTIPTFDRRKDRALGALDAAITAAGVKEKAATPERAERPRGEKPRADRGERKFGRGGNGAGASRGPGGGRNRKPERRGEGHPQNFGEGRPAQGESRGPGKKHGAEHKHGRPQTHAARPALATWDPKASDTVQAKDAPAGAASKPRKRKRKGNDQRSAAW
ncbi:MAG TPA: DEAD/DEAH box helicase [Caulobacteraceae bacterium]|nr:DEAD/DEAH box helicase [Caulobacteraceae bacterium]